jgi:Flp pilus assembly protein TadB
VWTIAFGLGCVLGFLPASISRSRKRMVSFEALAARWERWLHLRSLSTQQERHILDWHLFDFVRFFVCFWLFVLFVLIVFVYFLLLFWYTFWHLYHCWRNYHGQRRQRMDD